MTETSAAKNDPSRILEKTVLRVHTGRTKKTSVGASGNNYYTVKGPTNTRKTSFTSDQQ